jgi:hypothetical protein
LNLHLPGSEPPGPVWNPTAELAKAVGMVGRAGRVPVENPGREAARTRLCAIVSRSFLVHPSFAAQILRYRLERPAGTAGCSDRNVETALPTIPSTIDLKDIATLAAAVAGGSFALWRWTVDQKWRRVQYAQTLVKEFFEKRNVIKACEVIDTVGDVQFEDENNPKKHHTLDITTKFLLDSFTTFDQKEENTDDEILIRDVFDDLFGGLSVFQSHIETGLIKLQDISPYLEYWIKELSGNGHVHDEAVAHQIRGYLAFFGYDRVLILARDMGYPFKQAEAPSSDMQREPVGRPARVRRRKATTGRAP